ncbi:MAG TPA: inositol monophosphatase family protein [Acidimicrobiales bacterium]|nr:inositol monophosphatase family protein [Acidimicrobiales bacterium]
MADLDVERLLGLAVDLARDAGALLLDGTHRSRTDVDTKSSRTDMVTEMDRASEASIVAGLRSARPQDAILGEEGTASAGTSGLRWVIDPLDGTTNYLYGFPSFAVSIAAELDGRGVVGVVHDPLHSETFTAVAGRGARRNGQPLRVGGATDLATALVGTGFAYQADRRAGQAAVLTRVLPEVRDVRRAGAAALDLCWLACGRLDAFYEQGLAPWDSAAGSLVAGEAGAWVRPRPGAGDGLPDDLVVACDPGLTDAFVTLLARAHAGPGLS